MKFSGHDWFLFLRCYGRYLLRDALPEHLYVVVRDMFLAIDSAFATSFDVTQLPLLEKTIIASLTQFEARTPSTEHSVMFHQLAHLVECIRDVGPVHEYWMFPFERFH